MAPSDFATDTPDETHTADTPAPAAGQPPLVRQVQGALGSSQGDAGARQAAPVEQPGADQAEATQPAAGEPDVTGLDVDESTGGSALEEDASRERRPG